MLQWIVRAGFGVGLFALAASAAGEVLITEIMYDPASDEKPPVRTEWVELYNNGQEAVDVGGWYLADEDGRTQPLPAGTMIEARQTIVLVPGDVEGNAAAFRAAWGEGCVAYALADWSKGKDGMSGLANAPSTENEILTLRDSGEQAIDEVNYRKADPWPKGKAGASIYLAPTALTAVGNDDGANWRRSEFTLHGALNAKATEVFSDRDCGSPGTVAAE